MSEEMRIAQLRREMEWPPAPSPPAAVPAPTFTIAEIIEGLEATAEDLHSDDAPLVLAAAATLRDVQVFVDMTRDFPLIMYDEARVQAFFRRLSERAA